VGIWRVSVKVSFEVPLGRIIVRVTDPILAIGTQLHPLTVTYLLLVRGW